MNQAHLPVGERVSHLDNALSMVDDTTWQSK
jgi:hypothetical protein